MLRPAPPLAVPAGPLAVRWLAYELPELRAGALATARVEVENAGSAAWRGYAIHAAHHWLDPLGNPIVWGALGVGVDLEPGERRVVELRVRAPMPPGRYVLAFDLVNDGRYWFTDIGNARLELVADVRPRIARRRLRLEIGDGAGIEETKRALAAQDEPVVDDDADVIAYLSVGCRPEPDWTRRLLDAHEEGFAAVGGGIRLEGGLLERRRYAKELAPWLREFGRSPAWTLPLLCPSLVAEHAAAPPWTDPVAGMPAFSPGLIDEPTLCDGRIRVVAAATTLRPGGRPPA